VVSDDASLLFDVTRLIWRRWHGLHPTGIDRVCLAYLERYAEDAQAVVQQRRIRRILDRRSSSALFDLLAKPHRHFRRELMRVALRFGLRRSCNGRGRLYLNLGHTGLNEDGFVDWVRQAGVRPIYFVHDLIPITHPEYCRAGEREKHAARVRTVLMTAAGVITNSGLTVNHLEDFARQEELKIPPTVAALLGSDALPSCSPNASKTEPPTFVILGTIEARKNHLLLLQVWSRIVERLGQGAPRLLVIGQRGWECEQAIDLLERAEALKGSVIEIGACSDEMLAFHLANARALLFPSLVEGYGLPLVEALRAGVPVIASDLQVFREIAGDVPDYLDPLDGLGWERAILNYTEDASSARGAQLERIAGYRAPTWEEHFSRVRIWLSTL
jgi:glycosyltransferase involved in cell wall biosynthesis